MNKVSRQHIRLDLLAMALFIACGSAWAQSDSPYVIKVRNSGHYLAHVRNSSGDYVLGDLSSFSPECLWYSGIEFNISGTNHNYYFYDTVTDKYRYITAPLMPNSTLGLSDDMPATYLLSNTDTIYYFYDWDSEANGDGGGVARGHQFTGITNETTCEACSHTWGDGQCWDVYWIAYKNGAGWKTSNNSYDIDHLTEYSGGRFHKVESAYHPKEVQSVSGGSLATLSDWTPTTVPTSSNTPSQSYYVTASSYTYSYIPEYNTYTFREMKQDSSFINHTYHFSGSTQVTPPLTPQTASGIAPKSYEWTLSGEAAQFLSFASTGALVHSLSGDITGTSQALNASVYYVESNRTGTKTATLKLVVAYEDGSTQERTATITLTTECQNPPQAATPVVSYDDVLVTWYDIADSYKVYLKKGTEATFEHSETTDEDFYIFEDLEPNTEYNYKVNAICSGVEQTTPENIYSFTTRQAHELLIYGSVFGGGRMANVNGSTEVIVVNCDSLGAVYGGNDIAGVVSGSSSITLGENSGTYPTSSTFKVGAVYGGGNGYYAYGSQNFTPINTTTVPIEGDGNVYAYNLIDQQWNNPVWSNGATGTTLTIPSITSTAITVNSDYVKVDTVFGGAKNAFLTASTGNGSTVTINGGTIQSVFGGNNVGGSQGAAQQYIKVDEVSDYQTRIHTLFGSGNKVNGSSTNILVNGGQIDTLYAGGNDASVATAARVEINCALASGSGNKFGHTYSDAIQSYSGGKISVSQSYPWNGTGTYNVRTLFGGNNKADMAIVPQVVLTSGSVGTVYGGGNAGDMNGGVDDPGTIANDFGPMVFYNDSDDPNDNITITRKYGTHVTLGSDQMLVDYLYGGCQMSNVYYSSWVEVSDGHVGTIYGGCNISGDVGSNYFCDASSGYLPSGYDGPWQLGPRNERYQAVKGATFVKMSGGTVYKDLFAGSNGRYHCNNGKLYIEGINFDDLDTEGRYLGMTVPTHNETHALVKDAAVILGNVYAGGNLASVGFIRETVIPSNNCPRFVGLATIQMDGGTVHGNVFGGGNMASIWGSNAVAVKGGTIGGALYGGNDRIGLVAQITNRVLPPDYGLASDGYTSLADVRTYISLTGRPDIETVYGGGNGDYDYSVGQYCNPNDQPVQSNTFVDVNIDGFADGETPGGRINTVYGGGNGVTVTGSTTVFLNVKGQNGGEPTAYAHVGTIFGGNNKGSLAILPNIVLLKGQVDTVYGGCNQGSMIGNHEVALGGTNYENIGSLVYLRDSYTANSHTAVPTAVVRKAAYGGCRMNGVDKNSLVIIESGNHGVTESSVFNGASFFGGSDISGTIGGKSQVVLTGGKVGSIYGGGNGNYSYTDALAGLSAPTCTTSQVNILGGTVGDENHTDNVYGGGLGAGTSTTGNVDVTVNSSSANIWGDVYGGSALGSVNTGGSDKTNVTLASGTIHGDLYGGGHGDADNAAAVKGAVQVTVNGGTVTGSVYGCNNVNGAPQSTVNVDIYGTDMPTSGYALGKVFGGGNQAAYNNTPIVKVHNCNNKIEYVYGGGNAADVKGTDVTIYGGNTIGSVFGGCYGADVTDLGTNVKIYGGTIDTVYGGNNQSGSIAGDIKVDVKKQADTDPNGSSTACAMKIKEVYGGGNKAASSAGEITIECTGEGANEGIDYVYGGANRANVTGPIVLNIKEGRIGNVFGGNNNSGEITGDITVNIEKKAEPCVWEIGDVFGGGNLAVYGGTPEVNIKNGAVANVFGGGNGDPTSTSHEPGQVAGSIVNIGDNVNGHLAEVTGNVYGGGNAANVGSSGTKVNMNVGKVSQGIYGGCNTNGTVTGNIEVNINGGTLGVEGTPMASGIFGGGYGAATQTSGNVTLNLGDASHEPTIFADVYGGSALGNVNAGTDNTTTINFAKGNLTGNLYGGGLGDNNNAAEVKGNVLVNLGSTAAGPTIAGSVFGANNVNGSPKGGVTVNVYQATLDSIFGGGNQAAYVPTDDGSSYPALNIMGGNITHKVVGGGNQAGVTANPVINISGGTLCTGTNYSKLGIYGGCNTSGTVTGDITLNITGDDTHQTTIGTQGAISLDNKKPINVHGGGYGAGTSTTGNVTVNYGTIDNDNLYAYAYPMLYGDIYGGSGFGQVNDAEADKTTVNILNGSFKYTTETVGQTEYQYGGNIYGGGLGSSAHEAKVNGEVHLNIGDYRTIPSHNGGDSLKFLGKADLVGCNIYGCNNVNGSPQHNVFVDVYSTKRTSGVNTVDDLDFAAQSVFGGGNLADYSPLGTTERTHVYIHGCENTVQYVYGGGNAADAYGVETIIEGGHFDEVFGGGNGLVSPANIGAGGIGLVAFGGHVNFLYEGSNKQGTNAGGTYHPAQPSSGFIDCGDLFVDSYFFGDNEAEHIGDLTNTITCEQSGSFQYKYVYAGSRYAIIYGDVNLTVCGGHIENLFGGSRGYNLFPADIRKYPTQQEIEDNPDKYSDAIKAFMTTHGSLAGQGGNVNLNINGGTVGNIYGGCDVKGNVEGKINLIVDDAGSSTCPLFVGNVYGASNLTEYQPTDTTGVFKTSPDVKIYNGTVGGTATFQSGEITFEGNVYGGGNQGKITSNPKVTIGYTDNTKSAIVKGNVYGGGNAADVEGDTKVLLQGNAEVKTNVFGGGRSADVKGSTQVLLGE